MAKVNSSFSPVAHGFQFANYFQFKFPVKFPLPFVGELDLNDVVFGLCGGMCAAALDYFHANRAVPDYDRPDIIDSKLFTYLCERQLQSLSIPVLLKIIEWMMAENDTLVTRMTRYEIPKIRRSLDKGQPVILCLIRVHGLNNPTQNHQVLATAYDPAPDGKSITLTLYDPNHPCDEPTITLGLAKNGFAISQSSGEPLRGVFVLPYTRVSTLPKPPAPQPVSFAAGGFQLHWPVDSRCCTQHFNEHPEWYTGFGLPGHEGLDLLALDGASIKACADGVVTEAGPREGHPYGIQVRIKHPFGSEEYETIYAHLRECTVRVGQQVIAGQEIGRADSTGNSTGPHLHLTLKRKGAKTGKYPDGIIDPWPYLVSGITPIDEPPPSPSGITVYTTCQLNLRAEPNTSSPVVTSLPVAESLAVLGKAETERPKIGKQDQWLQVQTASTQVGYVAAWLVSDAMQEAFPPSGLVVYPINQANLRSGPGTTFDLLGSFSHMDPLAVMGNADTAKAKIGRQNQWLQVQAQNGQRGFIAAWLVHLTGQVPPASGLVVYPTDMLNVRARPSADGNVLVIVTPADSLTVLGDKAAVQPLIGQQGQWLNVQTPTKLTGYVAAWLVRTGSNGSQPAPAPTGLNVFTTDYLNVRASQSTNAPVIKITAPGEALTILDGDLAAARAKVGQQGQWLYVQTASGHRGWAAAWFLKL